jgi:competence protein ComFB
MPEEKYILVNAYDDLVRQSVRDMMYNMDMCKCEKCFLDACAIVFNNRYCRFVTTRKGAVMTKIPETSHNNRVEMMVVIAKALQLVRDFPQH